MANWYHLPAPHDSHKKTDMLRVVCGQIHEVQAHTNHSMGFLFFEENCGIKAT